MTMDVPQLSEDHQKQLPDGGLDVVLSGLQQLQTAYGYTREPPAMVASDMAALRALILDHLADGVEGWRALERFRSSTQLCLHGRGHRTWHCRPTCVPPSSELLADLEAATRP